MAMLVHTHCAGAGFVFAQELPAENPAHGADLHRKVAPGASVAKMVRTGSARAISATNNALPAQAGAAGWLVAVEKTRWESAVYAAVE